LKSFFFHAKKQLFKLLLTVKIIPLISWWCLCWGVFCKGWVLHWHHISCQLCDRLGYI